MQNIVAFLVILFSLQEVPYKPTEEFEIKLDYKFKQRPEVDRNTVNLDETRKEYEQRTSSSLLPYLILNVKLLKLSPEESKGRITNNHGKSIPIKKVEEGNVIPLDLGFTDDVKDKVTANQFTVTFLSAEKKEISKIVIFIEEDGSFLVNGEKRGRF